MGLKVGMSSFPWKPSVYNLLLLHFKSLPTHFEPTGYKKIGLDS